jgi:hypothetical protein
MKTGLLRMFYIRHGNPYQPENDQSLFVHCG